ncbi:MAG: choice-of-anchor J domain-containing protein [Aequorivita sp.]|nr:choice-of-anchor J domain-containing protein [Aequorivita sp.]
MKTLKNIKLLSFLFFLGMIVTSCVQDDDYSIPEITASEPNINPNDILSIATVKDLYGGFDPVEIEAGDGSTRDIYLVGYVVSSDETGNFYKTLVIQDSPENPTAGVSISTNSTDLYTKFEPGRKIYLKVNGLFIGEYAGLPTIGVQDGDEVGRIDALEFESRILRSLESPELVPTVISVAEANNPARLNTLVKFENVQFPNGLAGVEHYGNLNNTFGVNRAVENCEGQTVILRTSGFADFKNLTLPEGNGTLTAVLSIFNSDVQLFINGPEDVDMTGERCSNGGPGDAVELPFSQDFEGQSAGTGMTVNIEGWTNVNVNTGTRLWEVREFNNNKYAQTTAYNSNENPYEVWLVTPGLILPSGSTPTLNFDTNDGFNNGDALTVKVSTDFTGDVTTATWTNLNATISTGNTSGYGSSFTPSGDVDLSAYAGQVVYIAYQYVGASNGTTTTYQIDNVSVVE